MTEPKIAVLLPCRDEEAAIASVVQRFRAVLPTALIYVYDNDSSDRTETCAEEAGAIVRREPVPGKGNVVRRMFADVDADVYVLADGDDTYEAEAAPEMIEKLLREQLDMVVGVRTGADEPSAYRPGHRFGNELFTRSVGTFFGQRFNDILSGYRIFSRRFVRSFPALSTGFEIETELTVHALSLRLPVGEVHTKYASRPANSASKLSTFGDGLRIAATLLLLFKEVKPFALFGGVFAVLSLTSLALSYPLLTEFLETGLVPRLPTGVLATGLMLLAFLSLGCGMILDSVARSRREIKHLAYLAVPPFSRSEQVAEDARTMQSRLSETWARDTGAQESGTAEERHPSPEKKRWSA